jgi:hypothetical protein
MTIFRLRMPSDNNLTTFNSYYSERFKNSIVQYERESTPALEQELKSRDLNNLTPVPRAFP